MINFNHNFFSSLTIGHWGNLCIGTALLSAILGFVLYGAAVIKEKNTSSKGLYCLVLHALSICCVITLLFVLIFQHRFDYYYVWRHSSSDLPIYYLISCFWEGQEGSFLLWMFWHIFLLIFFVGKKNNTWKNGVIAVILFIQILLCAMLLGFKFGSTTVGSNPFMLWKNAVDITSMQVPSYFVPQEGNGLNPLLQNYWMAIHPPILFLGFASMSFPFAFCIVGIWKKKIVCWIGPATFWVLFTLFTLGLGILMGAYWAYETLSFGGYWSWDPVENAVYIPWIILLAGMHAMLIAKKQLKGVKTTCMLILLAFLLTWYATFLTRSGILGNTSVHSFTDLGFSTQLVAYLFFFCFIIIISFFRLKKLSKKIIPISNANSLNNWLLLAALILFLMGLQVLIPTSIPVYNTVLAFFGIKSNLAPPIHAIAFYTYYQLIFAVFILVGSATAQFFWFKQYEKKICIQQFSLSCFVSLACTLVLVLNTSTYQVNYIILLIAGIYAIVLNSITLFSIFKAHYRPSGGFLAHMGVAIMILGILFSSGYEKILSKNSSGLRYSKDFSTSMNTEHMLLWINDPKAMPGYTVQYAGQYFKALGYPGYIAKQSLMFQKKYFVAKEDIVYNNKIFFAKNTVVPIDIYNIYYKIVYNDYKGKQFILYPQSQHHTQKNLSAVPAIKCFWHKDLYTYISAVADPTQEKIWHKKEIFTVMQGKNFFVNDFIAQIMYIEKLDTISDSHVQLSPQDVAIKAVIKISGKVKDYMATPIYIIQNKRVGYIPFIVEDLGIKINFLNIHPEKKEYSLEISSTQRDYIVLKVMEKPWITLLWIGSIVMLIGFLLSILRYLKRKA